MLIISIIIIIVIIIAIIVIIVIIIIGETINVVFMDSPFYCILLRWRVHHVSWSVQTILEVQRFLSQSSEYR